MRVAFGSVVYSLCRVSHLNAKLHEECQIVEGLRIRISEAIDDQSCDCSSICGSSWPASRQNNSLLVPLAKTGIMINEKWRAAGHLRWQVDLLNSMCVENLATPVYLQRLTSSSRWALLVIVWTSCLLYQNLGHQVIGSSLVQKPGIKAALVDASPNPEEVGAEQQTHNANQNLI